MSFDTLLKVVKRSSKDRGHSNLGWLDSHHSFSFGEYMDTEHMGFRSLRVINQDIVEPGQGFGTHSHHSMEIMSYVIEGELEHKDSLGNGRIIKAGEFQFMSAGSGVNHSEFNPSPDNKAHFLQIWIQPSHGGGEPRYMDFDTTSMRQDNGLALLASPDGVNGSAAIRQDAEVYFGQLDAGNNYKLESDESHPYIWIQMIHGEVILEKLELGPGDGAAIEGSEFELRAVQDAEYLLFRLS